MPSFLDDRVDSDAILEDIRSIVEIESPSRSCTRRRWSASARGRRFPRTTLRSFRARGWRPERWAAFPPTSPKTPPGTLGPGRDYPLLPGPSSLWHDALGARPKAGALCPAPYPSRLSPGGSGALIAIRALRDLCSEISRCRFCAAAAAAATWPPCWENP